MSTVRNGIQFQTGLGGSNPTLTAAQRTYLDAQFEKVCTLLDNTNNSSNPEIRETVRRIKAQILNNIVRWRQSIGGNANDNDIYYDSNNLPFLKNCDVLVVAAQLK